MAVSFARQFSNSSLTLVEYGIEGKGVSPTGWEGSVGQAHSGLGELCPQAVRLSSSASSSSTQGNSAGLGSTKGGVFFTLEFAGFIEGFRDCFCGLLGLCFFHLGNLGGVGVGLPEPRRHSTQRKRQQADDQVRRHSSRSSARRLVRPGNGTSPMPGMDALSQRSSSLQAPM